MLSKKFIQSTMITFSGTIIRNVKLYRSRSELFPSLFLLVSTNFINAKMARTSLLQKMVSDILVDLCVLKPLGVELRTGLQKDIVMFRAPNCSRCPEKQQCTWFVQAYIFHNVTAAPGTPSYSYCTRPHSLEFVFPMEPVVPKDRIVREVGSINLQIVRSTYDGELLAQKQQQDPGKWYSLTTFAYICGMVSVVHSEGEQPFSLKYRSESSSDEQFHK